MILTKAMPPWVSVETAKPRLMGAPVVSAEGRLAVRTVLVCKFRPPRGKELYFSTSRERWIMWRSSAGSSAVAAPLGVAGVEPFVPTVGSSVVQPVLGRYASTHQCSWARASRSGSLSGSLISVPAGIVPRTVGEAGNMLARRARASAVGNVPWR